MDELRFLGGALTSLGIGLGIAAAAAGMLAADHMAAAVELCGPTADHCNQCVAAGALIVAAICTVVIGLELVSRPRTALLRAT
jgi:hypothetical protein